MLLKALTLATALLASGFVNAAPAQQVAPAHKHLCDFMPKNNFKIPITHDSSQMTEVEFNKILDLVQTIYTPIIAAQTKELFSIERAWTDDTVNAYADRGTATDPKTGKSGPARVIHMYGGLARHPMMTPEGFMLVACHEIGHHLGGYPHYNGQNWASDEGEADYFSTTKCARNVMNQLPTNLPWLQRHHGDDPTVSAQCQQSWGNDADKLAICMRSSVAGLALGRVLGSLGGNANVNFNTPDKSVVSRTNDEHPEAQCRLDTYFQGALCQRSKDEVMGAGPGFGACEAPRDTRGLRPACWYKATGPAKGMM